MSNLKMYEGGALCMAHANEQCLKNTALKEETRYFKMRVT